MAMVPSPGFMGGPPMPPFGAPPWGPPMAPYDAPPMWFPPMGPMGPPPPGMYFDGPPHPGRSRSRSRSRDGDYRRNGRRGKGGNDRGRRREPFKPYHSETVPRSTDLEAEADSGERKTTAMLRNIPNKYEQASLLDEIDSEGFADEYDFFYLPMDMHNKTNVGYAFVNFLESRELDRFCTHFEGYRFKKVSSHKIAAVCPAHVQGLEKNIQQLAKKAVTQFRNSEYRPIVLRDGKRIDFNQVAKEMNQT